MEGGVARPRVGRPRGPLEGRERQVSVEISDAVEAPDSSVPALRRPAVAVAELGDADALTAQPLVSLDRLLHRESGEPLLVLGGGAGAAHLLRWEEGSTLQRDAVTRVRRGHGLRRPRGYFEDEVSPDESGIARAHHHFFGLLLRLGGGVAADERDRDDEAHQELVDAIQQGP